MLASTEGAHAHALRRLSLFVKHLEQIFVSGVFLLGLDVDVERLLLGLEEVLHCVEVSQVDIANVVVGWLLRGNLAEVESALGRRLVEVKRLVEVQSRLLGLLVGDHGIVHVRSEHLLHGVEVHHVGLLSDCLLGLLDRDFLNGFFDRLREEVDVLVLLGRLGFLFLQTEVLEHALDFREPIVAIGLRFLGETDVQVELLLRGRSGLGYDWLCEEIHEVVFGLGVSLGLGRRL